MTAPPREEPPQAPGRTGAWPHVRALLVAAHIIAVVLLAVPDAAGVVRSRSAWKNPTVQGELEAWAERLTALGLETDAATLEDEVFTAAKSWTEAMAVLRAPAKPYDKYLGVHQTWRMFVAPHRHPVTLHVDLKEEGRWRPIQVARSDEHRWRDEQFDHVRARALLFRFGWKRYRRHYAAFARWVAARAAQDFPAASHVRIRLYGFRTPTPQEARAGTVPEGKFRQAIVHALEDFR